MSQDLGFGFVLLEVMSHHAGALVRAGRAAEGVFGGYHNEGAAVGHGIQLTFQQTGLIARFPGVRGQQGSGFVIAFQRVPAKINTG
jgi:hypothetical protein